MICVRPRINLCQRHGSIVYGTAEKRTAVELPLFLLRRFGNRAVGRQVRKGRDEDEADKIGDGRQQEGEPKQCSEPKDQPPHWPRLMAPNARVNRPAATTASPGKKPLPGGSGSTRG